jgi:hypothetical protein
MHLSILNKETSEALDKFQAGDWLQAIQHVETNKEKYLSGLEKLEIRILNKKARTFVNWTLTPKIQHSLLKDKILVE